jgi:hypothetical protein
MNRIRPPHPVAVLVPLQRNCNAASIRNVVVCTIGTYDTAQVCRRGHVINNSAHRYSAHNRRFCPKCGQPTMMACEHCHTGIQGEYHGNVISLGGEEPTAPAYCHNCGKPYPWTAERLEAAQALAAELENLDDGDRIAINATIEELAVDSARTPVAVLRFKKIIAKAKGPARELLLDAIAKIAVESAKAGLGI